MESKQRILVAALNSLRNAKPEKSEEKPAPKINCKTWWQSVKGDYFLFMFYLEKLKWEDKNKPFK